MEEAVRLCRTASFGYDCKAALFLRDREELPRSYQRILSKGYCIYCIFLFHLFERTLHISRTHNALFLS